MKGRIEATKTGGPRPTDYDGEADEMESDGSTLHVITYIHLSVPDIRRP